MTTHVITGAGSGIGAAVARRLADRGDRLVLIARSADRADDLAHEFGERHQTLVIDLSDPDSLTATQPWPDHVDSLVHVAGAVQLGPVAELTPEAWTEQLEVNLRAPALLSRALLPALRAARGTVVFVNSTAGLTANAGWSAYAASKFGLRALADSLRAEEAAHGVRVTSVFPGRTATPMQEAVHRHEGKNYEPRDWIDPGSVAEVVLQALDLPGDATLSDVSVRPR